MALSRPLYFSEDKTGANPANLVYLEDHALVNPSQRIFKPDYGAYFTKSLVVYSVNSAGERAVLVRGVHYTCVEMLVEQTQRCGQEVCGAVLLTKEAAFEALIFNYQALGGEGSADFHSLATAVQELYLTGKAVDWDDILDKPRGFTPSAHLHDCLDLYGMEYLVESLNTLAGAVDKSDDAHHDQIRLALKRAKVKTLAEVDLMIIRINKHIVDRNNPHKDSKAQIGLAVVENYKIHTAYRALYGDKLIPGSFYDTYEAAAATYYVGPLSVNQYILERSALFKETNWTIPVSAYTNLSFGVVKPTGYDPVHGAIYPVNYIKQTGGFYTEYREYVLLNHNSGYAKLVSEILDYKISMRRSSSIVRDKDIYSVPDKFPGLYCWLDFSDKAAVNTAADTTSVTVSRIIDKGPIERTFSATSLATAPVFSKSKDYLTKAPGLTRGTVANFTSGTQHLDLTKGPAIVLKPGMTIITVSRAGFDNSGLFFLSEKAKQTSPESGGFIASHGNAKRALVAHASADVILAAAPPESSKANTSGIAILSISDKWEEDCWGSASYPASFFTYRKGIGQALTPTAVLGSSYVGASLNRIGLNTTGYSQQGEFAELLIYERQLSKREVDAIVNYLRLKWSSDQSLPMDLKFVQLLFQAP